MTILLCILWYLVGSGSFIYWCTRNSDFTTEVDCIVLCLMGGLVGPLTFIIGGFIEGGWGSSGIKPVVLVKSRKR